MIAAQRSPLPGRPASTLAQRLNPLWLASDRCRPVGTSSWRWFIRNPFANGNAVVWGVSHLQRVTVTTASPWTYTTGWNFGWTIADGRRGLLPLPLISYRGRWPLGWLHRFVSRIPAEIECGFGWKTNGGFTPFTFRAAHAGGHNED